MTSRKMGWKLQRWTSSSKLPRVWKRRNGAPPDQNECKTRLRKGGFPNHDPDRQTDRQRTSLPSQPRSPRRKFIVRGVAAPPHSNESRRGFRFRIPRGWQRFPWIPNDPPRGTPLFGPVLGAKWAIPTGSQVNGNRRRKPAQMRSRKLGWKLQR